MACFILLPRVSPGDPTCQRGVESCCRKWMPSSVVQYYMLVLHVPPSSPSSSDLVIRRSGLAWRAFVGGMKRRGQALPRRKPSDSMCSQCFSALAIGVSRRCTRFSDSVWRRLDLSRTPVTNEVEHDALVGRSITHACQTDLANTVAVSTCARDRRCAAAVFHRGMVMFFLLVSLFRTSLPVCWLRSHFLILRGTG